MRPPTLLLPALVALALAGCSQQSKEEYSQAGQSLKQAAKETGKAVKQDTSVAAQAAKNATTAAKNTIETKKMEHQRDAAKPESKSNG